MNMSSNVELTGAARRFIAQRPATERSEVERQVRLYQWSLPMATIA